MNLQKLIEVLQEAHKDWFKNVIWSNEDFTDWWNFEIDYSENEEWENADVVLKINRITIMS